MERIIHNVNPGDAFGTGALRKTRIYSILCMTILKEKIKYWNPQWKWKGSFSLTEALLKFCHGFYFVVETQSERACKSQCRCSCLSFAFRILEVRRLGSVGLRKVRNSTVGNSVEIGTDSGHLQSSRRSICRQSRLSFLATPTTPTPTPGWVLGCHFRRVCRVGPPLICFVDFIKKFNGGP